MDNPPTNAPEYSVSEISNALKRTVEDAFGHVRVRGELGRVSRAGSGHIYLTLKDENAVLDGVCWKGVASRLPIRPEEGLEVIVTGRLSTYPGRSSYQIIIDSMELAGEGALLKLLEERKRKLAAEGLFDPARKKPIPFLPTVIGVVTSPTGAVIRDILHRLNDRFPRHVLVWPVLVQGEGAAAQIANAIEGFNRMDGSSFPRPDLLIVARGGGSLEDLWPFNEEVVARAAASSAIPLISAVGHETDTTLIDYVSDRRAPTPTAAAEMAVPVRVEILQTVMEFGRRAVGAMARQLTEHARHIEGLARGLPEPMALLGNASQRLDDLGERLGYGRRVFFDSKRQRLDTLSQRLRSPDQVIRSQEERLSIAVERLNNGLMSARRGAEHRYRSSDMAGRLQAAMARQLTERQRTLAQLWPRLENLSYKKVLERGFAVVRDDRGTPVLSSSAAKSGDSVMIEFRDGKVGATIGDASETDPGAKQGGGASAKAKPSSIRKEKGKDIPEQGSLL